MKKKISKEDAAHTRKFLLNTLRSGKYKVYTVVHHVSSSGMSRCISCFVADKAGHVQNITYWVSEILEYPMSKNHSGMVVGGCGMDMGFHVIYSLSRTLFPKGFKVPKGQYGRNGDTSGWDKDGGYKLKHEWL